MKRNPDMPSRRRLNVDGGDGVHGSDPLHRVGFLSFWSRINIIERDVVPERFCVGNQPAGRVRWNGLASFVMAYVALGAAHAFCKGALGQAKALSNRFYVVHERNNSNAALNRQ